MSFSFVVGLERLQVLQLYADTLFVFMSFAFTKLGTIELVKFSWVMQYVKNYRWLQHKKIHTLSSGDFEVDETFGLDS